MAIFSSSKKTKAQIMGGDQFYQNGLVFIKDGIVNIFLIENLTLIKINAPRHFEVPQSFVENRHSQMRSRFRHFPSNHRAEFMPIRDELTAAFAERRLYVPNAYKKNDELPIEFFVEILEGTIVPDFVIKSRKLCRITEKRHDNLTGNDENDSAFGNDEL